MNLLQCTEVCSNCRQESVETMKSEFSRQGSQKWVFQDRSSYVEGYRLSQGAKNVSSLNNAATQNVNKQINS